jgi:glutathione S-transferase
MAHFTIYLGNKTYSSWSLRGWLAMKHVGVPFDEVVIPFEGTTVPTKAIRAKSPSGRVPFLDHDGFLVWDSLAIGEYLADLFPAARLWPEDVKARALARSASAEMHSSFAALRSAMPMNVRRPPFTLPHGDDVKEDIARIVSLWTACRRDHGQGGPFLFGAFTMADAMYAPVATRFRTYGVPLDGAARAYVEAIHEHPAMREWIDAARRETWRLEGYEAVGT